MVSLMYIYNILHSYGAQTDRFLKLSIIIRLCTITYDNNVLCVAVFAIYTT